MTTDQLIKWLAEVHDPVEAQALIQLMLTKTGMPDWNHVCWTLQQDDDMARAMNNLLTWIKAANAYMDRAESENQKALNGTAASSEETQASEQE